MKTSEAIKMLEKILEVEGDLDICLETPYGNHKSPVELMPIHVKVENFMFDRIVRINYL